MSQIRFNLTPHSSQWPENDPKMTSKMANNRQKSDIQLRKMTEKWHQNGKRIAKDQSRKTGRKMTRKWPENDIKMAQKSHKIDAKLTQN